jgi:formylglycine-generating enzyme required for sulfatase activity
VQQDRLKPDWVPEADRVYRGGSWDDDPRGARVAGRSRGVPGRRRYDRLGFRLVRDTNHKGEHNVSDSSP